MNVSSQIQHICNLLLEVEWQLHARYELSAHQEVAVKNIQHP
jgi:hypothetical protein